MQLLDSSFVPLLIVGAIGVCVGVLVTLLFSPHHKEPHQSTGSITDAVAESTSGEPPSERFEAVARLYREKSSGKLVTEVDGKIYVRPDFMPAEMLREMRSVAEGWQYWLGGPSSGGLPPLEAVLPPKGFVPGPVPLEPEKPRATSMVEQIDEILQELLADSTLSSHSVRIIQDPQQGVVVLVDKQPYYGIDAVPDPEVQALIRTAVQRWEQDNQLGGSYS